MPTPFFGSATFVSWKKKASHRPRKVCAAWKNVPAALARRAPAQLAILLSSIARVFCTIWVACTQFSCGWSHCNKPQKCTSCTVGDISGPAGQKVNFSGTHCAEKVAEFSPCSPMCSDSFWCDQGFIVQSWRQESEISSRRQGEKKNN
jgi:RNA 3'-terminal phosphate cyclase